MASLTKLSGPFLPPASGNAPKQLVVLLHGLGSDGADLIDLAPHWAGLLPEAAFIAPNAPYPCDMAPYGYQWFSLQDWNMARMLAGIQAAEPVLQGFLDEALAQYGLEPSRLALVGFSQGTMMALHAAPRRAIAPAAVVGFSGALLGPELLPEQAVSKPPTLLIHGDADTVVPVQALPLAAESLRAAGISVETDIRRGLGHGIDPAGIARAGAFLQRAFMTIL